MADPMEIDNPEHHSRGPASPSLLQQELPPGQEPVEDIESLLANSASATEKLQTPSVSRLSRQATPFPSTTNVDTPTLSAPVLQLLASSHATTTTTTASSPSSDSSIIGPSSQSSSSQSSSNASSQASQDENQRPVAAVVAVQPVSHPTIALPSCHNDIVSVSLIGYDNVPSWPEYKDILRKRIDEIVSIYIEKDTWGQKVVAPNGSMFPMQEGVALPDERESTRLQLLSTLDAHMYPPWTLQRVSELLVDPNKLYKTLRKLSFALDKLLTLG